MTELLIKEVRDTGRKDEHENLILEVDGSTVTGEEFAGAQVRVKRIENAPKPGATSDWNLEQRPKGPYLSRAQQQGGFRGAPKDDERIARAVALKAAVDMAPEGVTSTDVVKVAETFLPFLRGED